MRCAAWRGAARVGRGGPADMAGGADKANKAKLGRRGDGADGAGAGRMPRQLAARWPVQARPAAAAPAS